MMYKPCPFCASTDIEDKAGIIAGQFCPGCMECGALAYKEVWNERSLGNDALLVVTEAYHKAQSELYALRNEKRLEIAAQFMAAILGNGDYDFSDLDSIVETALSTSEALLTADALLAKAAIP